MRNFKNYWKQHKLPGDKVVKEYPHGLVVLYNKNTGTWFLVGPGVERTEYQFPNLAHRWAERVLAGE